MRTFPMALAALLTIAALAGCSGDPTPTPTPTATATPAATATPMPTATAMPTEVPQPTATPTPVPGATAVTIEPAADATLYDRGVLLAANGAGDSLFFGSTNGNEPRRTLVRFDVRGAVPPGSTIVSARFVLFVTRSNGEPDPADIHRVTSSWGEGTTNSQTAGEGSGALPDDGSATWLHRAFPDTTWDSPGGDYASDPSATTLAVPPPRAFTAEIAWGSTEATIADVQGWLDDPSSNFGWIVIGKEGTRQTAKRTASRENPNAEIRPRLVVEYLPATGPQTLNILPSQDTTIYDDATLANGAGEWLFAGVTRRGAVRRALLRFDVTGAVPAGVTIDSATLTLTVSQSSTSEQAISLHEVLGPWSAGASDAEFNEGKGAVAQPGDATWELTGVGAERWTTPGGDYDPTPLATVGVTAVGTAPVWGPNDDLTALVQRWLDAPNGNHGVMLVGNESADHTAKRFDALENFSGFPEPHPPVLTITYTP